MNYFDKLAEFDIAYIIIGVIVIIMVVKFICDAFEWVCKKFGIEFKNEREKKEQLKRLGDNENKIKELKDQLDTTTIVLNKIDNSLSEITKDLSTIKECVEELKDNDLKQNNALVESLHDRIMQKCIYYINELRGLPFDEKDELIRLFDAYTKLGGNHNLNLTVNYCIDNLPLLTITRKVNQIGEEQKDN